MSCFLAPLHVASASILKHLFFPFSLSLSHSLKMYLFILSFFFCFSFFVLVLFSGLMGVALSFEARPKSLECLSTVTVGRWMTTHLSFWGFYFRLSVFFSFNWTDGGRGENEEKEEKERKVLVFNKEEFLWAEPDSSVGCWTDSKARAVHLAD